MELVDMYLEFGEAGLEETQYIPRANEEVFDEGQVFFDDIGAEFVPGHTFNYPEDSEEESPDLSELNATMRIYILT